MEKAPWELWKVTVWLESVLGGKEGKDPPNALLPL